MAVFTGKWGGAGRTQKVDPLKWELEELHEGSSSGGWWEAGLCV